MKVTQKLWLGLLAGVAAVTGMTSEAVAQDMPLVPVNVRFRG